MPRGLTIGGKKVRFELVSEDDQADPRTATIVAQKLVDAGVSGIIGHLNSGTTIPASKIYYDAGIVQISPSATNPKYTEQGFKTAFRVMPNDVQQGKVLGDYAVTRLGAKKIAIIDDRTAYGQGVADQFEKAAKAAGAEIVAREFTTDKSTDFMAILTAVKAKNAGSAVLRRHGCPGRADDQAIQVAGSERQISHCATAAARRNSSSCPAAQPKAHTVPCPACRSTRCPAARTLPKDSPPNTARSSSTRRIATMRSSVMIAAMQKAGSSDPAKYLPALAGIAYDGVTAKISFDAERRHQGRRHHPVPGQEWQVGSAGDGGRPGAGSAK